MEQINGLNDFLGNINLICEMIRELSENESKNNTQKKNDPANKQKTLSKPNLLSLFLELIEKTPPGYQFSEQSVEGFFFLAKAFVDFGIWEQIVMPIAEKYPQLLNLSWEDECATVLTYAISTRNNIAAKSIVDTLFAESPSLLIPGKGEDPLRCCLECDNQEMFDCLTPLIKTGQPDTDAS